jgi:hypothetical protein
MVENDKCIKLRLFDDIDSFQVNDNLYKIGCKFKLNIDDNKLYHKHKRFADLTLRRMGVKITEIDSSKSLYVIDYI